MRRVSKHLLTKSQEAFILALEVYNKPTIQYRIQAFSFLFCNAWELLLKAKIIEAEGKTSSIYYRKKRNQPRRTLSLRDCLKRMFQNEKDPVRRNIEEVIEIRDASVHFVIAELETIYQGMFQAGVLNFVSALQDWFGVEITEKCTPAMLSLLVETGDLEPTKLQRKYGKEVLDFFTQEQLRLDEAEREIKDTKYRIPIEYRLVLTKSSRGADITLSSGLGDQVGIILEVPKDIDKTHPYLTKEAILAIKEKLGEASEFNSYDFQAVIHKEKIKGKPQLHYKIRKPECHRYSENLIEFIADKLTSDDRYRSRARRSYSRHRRKMRDKRMQQDSV